MGDMGLPENRGFEWYSPRSEGNLYRENEVFSLKNISQTPGPRPGELAGRIFRLVNLTVGVAQKFASR
jgi:hypothetical protein